MLYLRWEEVEVRVGVGAPGCEGRVESCPRGSQEYL